MIKIIFEIEHIHLTKYILHFEIARVFVDPYDPNDKICINY